ncbi:patatin-like phospholipase family protein [Rhizobium sp. CC-YZS058]|uniref:patatin-like phospholipase family protein n=1 Tax=Rhizobium sp. CC-YZS058 TaxID=3042153 RepID=UPI002B053CF5|nr:patatin-like phospholipase family protein [Rhizobium sp. CC-YZS058]MEA3537078.1 patatin-like phospholipase family protein [Rhizobium sp. CC-YZS058]
MLSSPLVRGCCRPTLLIVLCLAMVLAGCATAQRSAYDVARVQTAQVPGFEGMRAFADAPPQSIASPAQWLVGTASEDVHLLALSGGGSGGAFSVGVLSAWTKRGDRPEFEVVTGVSTGALIAPFAFLGSRYDETLKELYVGDGARDLVDFNWKTGGLLGASVLKGQALRRMVERHVTRSLLDEIATEHRKGRRLFVVTTNLDAQRPVTWNMGAIANSGRPDAVALFQNVLLASASIPGVFPAVMIRARAGDTNIEEMHSDGGSSMQFFTLPEDTLTDARIRLPGAKRFHINVIVNNALIPEFATVNNRTLPVIGRAYAAMVKSQTRQGLLALYNFAQRSKSDFKVASIDQQVPYSVLDPFNQTYMQTVYQRGYSLTMEGKVWHDRPVFSSDTGSQPVSDTVAASDPIQ